MEQRWYQGRGHDPRGSWWPFWSLLGPPRAGPFAGGSDVVDSTWVLQAVVVVDVDVDGSLVACCLSPWLGGCCVPSY